MTKYLSRALILALLVFSAPPLMADSISEIIAKAKRAVVEIVTRDATGTPKDLGTGFFVSPDGLVVTNLTVIEGVDSMMAVSNKGATFLFERVVAQPVGVDLVVLKFHRRLWQQYGLLLTGQILAGVVALFSSVSLLIYLASHLARLNREDCDCMLFLLPKA